MQKRDLFYRIGAIVSVLLFAAVWLWNPTFSLDATTQLFCRSVIFRGLGSVVFVFVLLYQDFNLFSRVRFSHLAVVLPSLAVAINNFPILGYLQGTVQIARGDLIWLFALDCLLPQYSPRQPLPSTKPSTPFLN